MAHSRSLRNCSARFAYVENGVTAMGVEGVWRSAFKFVLESTLSCAARVFIVADDEGAALGAGADVDFAGCEWVERREVGGRVILDDAARGFSSVVGCWRLVLWVAPRVEFWRSRVRGV